MCMRAASCVCELRPALNVPIIHNLYMRFNLVPARLRMHDGVTPQWAFVISIAKW